MDGLEMGRVGRGAHLGSDLKSPTDGRWKLRFGTSTTVFAFQFQISTKIIVFIKYPCFILVSNRIFLKKSYELPLTSVVIICKV